MSHLVLAPQAWLARALSLVLAALVLLVAATPASAKKGRNDAPAKASAAKDKKPGTVAKTVNASLVGVAVAKAARERLTKVFELPYTEVNRLDDGRHLHIGSLSGMFYGAEHVGWVSPTEYVKLSSAQMKALLSTAGFNDMGEFLRYLEKAPPLVETPDPEAPPASQRASAMVEPQSKSQSTSWTHYAAIVGGLAALLGLGGYGFMAWRRTQDAAPAPDTSSRLTRVVASGAPTAPAPGAGPVARASVASATSSASRRAPRDLSAMKRQPA